MAASEADRDSTTALAIESIGMVCARAASVAIGVGFIEGSVLTKAIEASVPGITLATVGLWFPAAFLALLAVRPLRSVEGRGRTLLMTAFGAALVATLGFARFSHAPPIVRAAPAEVVSALFLAWSATLLRIEGFIRKPIAYAGLALAVILQVYATRWVDNHRGYAGVISECSFVPRVMLRNVLRRVV